jgi:FKBP-type peptidyl-prolyl cis-trans isomerase
VLDKAYRTVSSNVVTRVGCQVHGPPRSKWWAEEQAQKEKDTQEMSQEEENLVDPQDDIELQAREKEKLQAKEVQEKETEEEELNDSDDKTVDENQKEDEPNHERQEEVAPAKEKRVKQPQKKKMGPDKSLPPPKAKETSKGKVSVTYPGRLDNRKEEDLYKSFAKALQNLSLQLPLIDAI